MVSELDSFLGFIGERGFYLGRLDYKNRKTEIVDRENRPVGEMRALSSGMAVLNEVTVAPGSGLQVVTEDYVLGVSAL